MKKVNQKMILPAAVALSLFCAVPAVAGTWQQEANGQWVYMQDDNKKAVNQWVQWGDGTWRYVTGNGTPAVSRWLTVDGKKYYVDADGVRMENRWFSQTNVPRNPQQKESTTWYYAGADGVVYTDGWYAIGGKYYYFYAGGNSPRNSFFNLDGKKYYVDADGVRQQNGWFSTSGVSATGVAWTNWYYALSDGTMYVGGWVPMGGKQYYFDASGRSPRATWVNIDADRYYVDENGAMQTGWFSISGVSSTGAEWTNSYYARPNGILIRGGFVELDGKTYFFDANGLSYRKRWYVDGNADRYYMDENGVLQTGWFSIKGTNSKGEEYENRYYADADGRVLKGGTHTVDGKEYYFDANGLLYVKRWINIDSKNRCYAGEDGVLRENEWFSISGTRSDGSEYTNWYYADSKGIANKEGWITVDGKKYHRNSGGSLSTEWYDDKTYYLGEDGAMRTGWQEIEIYDDWIEDSERVSNFADKYGRTAWFYFSETSGKKRKCNSGTFSEEKVDGTDYIFDTYGIMQKGWVRLKGGSPAIRGYRYTYPETADGHVAGQIAKKTWVKTDVPDELNGSGTEYWYYFRGSGEPVCASAGKYVVEEIDGKKYAFDDQGHARFGLLKIDGSVYYFGPEGGDLAAVTGKCQIVDREDGTTVTYGFAPSGKGLEGIKDGYFYYEGRLQTASKGAKYEVFEVPGKGKRVISEAGKIMKNKTVKDSNGTKWKLGSGGVILDGDTSGAAEIEGADLEEYTE